MRVVWDDSKNRANQRKHGVSFFDEAHSNEEDRFIAVGPIDRGTVLVVYTERDEDTVRIISARWATRRETALYRNHAGGKDS